MTTTQNPFFQVGARMAAHSHGVDRDGLTRLMAKQAVMNTIEAAPFHRELCKIASAAFDESGDFTSAPAVLYRNLSNAKEWHPQYSQFTDPVLRALSKSAAAALLPGVAALHDKAGGGILKTLTAGGALGGAAIGSLAFLLSRNSQQSSAESAQLLEKVKTYKKLKRDIEEDLSSNGTL